MILFALLSFTVEPDSTKVKKRDQKEWKVLHEMNRKYNKNDYQKGNEEIELKLKELDSVMNNKDTSNISVRAK